MKDVIRVMLVDDHMVVRIGFRMLLDATPDIRVVAEADSAEAAYQQLEAASPDVILMDIGLGGTNGRRGNPPHRGARSGGAGAGPVHP